MNPSNLPVVKAYAAVCSARFRALLQYRAAAVAGFGTQLFWGLIRIMIFEAFFRSATVAQPMTYPEVATYIWLSQAFLVILPFTPDPDIRGMVWSGNVVYELLRPANLYFFWYSRALAQRTAPGVFRALPLVITALVFFEMDLPPDFLGAGAWFISMIFAVLISAALTNLLNISILWTLSGEGISVLVAASAGLLSGLVIPLAFFPDWSQAFIALLPFRYVMDIPFRFYLGHLAPGQIWTHLPVQIGHLIALIAAGQLILNRGIRRLVAQGG